MKKNLFDRVIWPVTVGPLAASLLLTAACAKEPDASRNWQPPPACFRGLNTNDCSIQLKDGSSWNSQIKFLRSDDRSGDSNQSTTVSTTYQFGKVGDKPSWQRIVTVDGGARKGKRTMYESGEVLAITETYLDLTLDSNTCPSEMSALAQNPSKFRLYYSRHGDNLRTSGIEIVEAKAEDGFGGLIGTAIGNALGDAFRGVFQGVFSFGSARTWMEMTDGNWSKVERLEPKDAGIIGCFGSIGNEFKPLALPTVDQAANPESSSK